ncbi:Annexin [Corchorus capsularis]|uniref:Annexin n=1 Tax=Corchorus capsularis TaxID=210143 RepID=A0A1R3GRS7_COCAP|nr:Annexin [Corchorus capsularis]
MSTVKVPAIAPSPRDDAMQIYRAFKGMGCDGAAIINVIAHRDASQRSFIQQEYETMYSEELRKRFSSELNGHFKKAVMLWMQEPGVREAYIIKNALKGAVKDQKAITEIICSRTSSQIGQLKRHYFTNVGSSLEEDIESEVSGDYKKLMLAFITTSRYEGPEYDEALVENDAKALHKAAKKFGLEEKTFIQIFSERSRAHLAAVINAYQQMFKKPLDKAIRNDTHKSFEYALKTIARCAESVPKFYAKALRKAMKGLGTADTALIRIVVTRAEIDLHYIKAEYRKKFGKTLNDAVHSETSGHYRTFLLALLVDACLYNYVAVRRPGSYDEALVENDAKALHKAAKKFGLEEKTFIQIFSERGRAHLAAVINAYQQMFKKPLDKAIRNDTHKSFEYALKTIARCAESVPKFYAKMGRIGDKLDIDFIISTGDNFYDKGLKGVNDPAFKESFTNIYTAESLQKQWYSILGNHDYRGDAKAQLSPILRKIDSKWLCLRSFILNTEIAEFFFVDTTPFLDKYFTEPDHNYDWRGVEPRGTYLANLLKDLELALRNSTAKWKFVVGHHAIRSVGHHGDTVELIQYLLPILKANNVDLYINGHDHCLQHVASRDSPIQYLTSGGGSKAWRGDIKSSENNDDTLKFFYDGQGFMSMKISDKGAVFAFYDIFGNVLHKWKISKDQQLHSAI